MVEIEVGVLWFGIGREGGERDEDECERNLKKKSNKK